VLCNDSSNDGDHTDFPNPLLFPSHPKPTNGTRDGTISDHWVASTPDDPSPRMHQRRWKNRLRDVGAIGWCFIANPVSGLSLQGHGANPREWNRLAGRDREGAGMPSKPPIFWSSLLFAASLLTSALVVLLGAFSLAGRLPAQPWQTSMGVMDRILPNLQDLEKQALETIPRQIAVLGDSTVDFYPMNEKVPDRLQQALARSSPPAPPVAVTNLAFLALGPTAYYFLADRIAASRPDLIVWAVSLTHASERWRRSLPRPELAGWMAAERIPSTLTMPIDDIGLTADELLLYQLLVRADPGSQWRDFRVNLSRIDKFRAKSEKWLAQFTGTQPEKSFGIVSALKKFKSHKHPDLPNRYNRLGEIEHFGTALDGIDSSHPTIRFIGAAVQVFSEARIPVLVYLNPVNIQHLEKVGVVEAPKLRRSVNAYREAVEKSGGFFLDLHTAFPDSHFSDMSGHFRHDDEIEAQTELAETLARYILDKGILDARPAQTAEMGRAK